MTVRPDLIHMMKDCMTHYTLSNWWPWPSKTAIIALEPLPWKQVELIISSPNTLWCCWPFTTWRVYTCMCLKTLLKKLRCGYYNNTATACMIGMFRSDSLPHFCMFLYPALPIHLFEHDLTRLCRSGWARHEVRRNQIGTTIFHQNFRISATPSCGGEITYPPTSLPIVHNCLTQKVLFAGVGFQFATNDTIKCILTSAIL